MEDPARIDLRIENAKGLGNTAPRPARSQRSTDGRRYEDKGISYLRARKESDFDPDSWTSAGRGDRVIRFPMVILASEIASGDNHRGATTTEQELEGSKIPPPRRDRAMTISEKRSPERTRMDLAPRPRFSDPAFRAAPTAGLCRGPTAMTFRKGLTWESILGGFQCLDWPKHPSGENAMNNPQKKLSSSVCISFSSGFPTKTPIERSSKIGFGKMEGGKMESPPAGMIEPTPRCLEDPRRTLSMQGLSEGLFGKIRHHLRKKQDTSAQVAVCLPQGHLVGAAGKGAGHHADIGMSIACARRAPSGWRSCRVRSRWMLVYIDGKEG